DRHLTRPEQVLLLALTTFERPVLVDCLRAATEVLDGGPQSYPDYKRALKVLEGTFITIERRNDHRTIAFSNPGLADFVLHWLSRDAHEVHALLRGAIYFGQSVTLSGHSSWSPRQGRRLFPELPAQDLADALARTFVSPETTVRPVWYQGS